MQKRPLGKTGFNVGLLSLGGESAIKGDGPAKETEAIEIIHEALDLGLNYIDTAPAYGPKTSEHRIGEVVQDGRGDEFYLATKCDVRNYKGAWRQINESVNRLGMTPDCIQLHHIDTMAEVDAIFNKTNGAFRALLKAKEEGLCRFVGVTGHSDPTVLLECLRRHRFDTALGALNIADPYAYSFQTKLIPYCESKGIGFIAMKVCARGKIFRKSGINSMEQCLRYVWSVPGVSTSIVGISNLLQLRKNKKIADAFKRLSWDEMLDLEALVEPYAEDVLYFRKNREWPEIRLPQLVL